MTYEYICTECGHEWEASQRINDKPLTECPNCKKATAKRQVSGGTGFVLKGGGWYADGYASGGASKAGAASSDAPPSKSTDGGASKKDTSAPASTDKSTAPAASATKSD